MAKDDDLLPEDQPAENLMPAEEQAQAAAPAAAPEAPGRAAVEPTPVSSPVAAELSAKPGNNVWTMLMLISILAMVAGIWIQAQELKEIFKINIIPGSKSEETATPAGPTEPAAGGGTTEPAAPVIPPADKPADKAGDKAGDTPATPK